MKSLVTLVTATAALLLLERTASRAQEPAALPAVQEELAQIQAQAQQEAERARQALFAAQAQAKAQAHVAREMVSQQLARAKEAVQLAQADAPGALAGAAASSAPAFRQRLQNIVTRGHGGSGKAVVIRTSDADARAQANLEEDLPVMSRIFDKTLAEKLDEDRQNRFMGINVLFGPGSTPIRSLYLEGYGALFLLSVNFPLLAPPEKPQETKEESETNSTWEDVKRELYGQHDAWNQVGKALKFSTAGGPEQEYDEKKVEDLKEGLLEALKNATNIRHLKSDEAITVCVFGGASAAPGKAKPAPKTKRVTVAPDDDGNELVLENRYDGTPAPGTILTIRVKKSDADAFAKGKLNLDDFRKKASITAYAGDTGGWGGRNWFGLTAP